MAHATPTPPTIIGVLARLVGIAIIGLISLLCEPDRQRFSAVFMAGAGAAYFAGGLGGLEIAFCAAVTLLAWRGLADYRAIGVAWLLHTGWDVAHDLYGNPIIPFEPTSSFGCAICDLVLALWYLLGAPDLYGRWRPLDRADTAPHSKVSTVVDRH